MAGEGLVRLVQQTMAEAARSSEPREQASVCRRLAFQLAAGVEGGQVDALLGATLMEEYLKEANSLVDDPAGINNYADECLTEQDRFENHSKDWQFSLSLEDPRIQEFVARHNRGAAGMGEDRELLRCLALPPKVEPKAEPKVEPKVETEDTWGLGEPDMEGDSFEPSPPQATPDPRHAPVPQPALARAPSVGRVPHTSKSSHRLEAVRQGGAAADRPTHRPEAASSGAFVFKTAGQQLALDRQRTGGRQEGVAPSGRQEGITEASYGAARRNLGTRPGPAAGFKPPVRQAEQQGSNSAAAVIRAAGGQEEQEEDPRYKNIDAKMIEMVKNEIMDQGNPVTWEDIAGLEFAKKTVMEIVVYPLLRPDIFTGLRGPPRGLLLFGPPGTGKTLIGKCIASQSRSTFFAISASALTSKWVGEGEKMVRALFAVAKVHQPSVVFIDEIDSLLTARSESDHESSRRIKTEFLVQLDGASSMGEERVLVVGATNRPQELDEAARRRLVKRLYIPLPEGAARRRIVTNLLKEERHSLTEEQVEEVVARTEGYSGADMANLCKEAAMGPVRSLDFGAIETMEAGSVRPISAEDFVPALRQVKASVSAADLHTYTEWDRLYGASK